MLARPAFELDEDAVSSISVSLTNRLDRGESIEDFSLPSRSHPEMVSLIEGASPHRSEIDWAVLGDLKIEIGSQVMDMRLFSGGKALIFEVRNGQGGKYEAGSLAAFLRLVDEARAAKAKD